MLLVTLGLRPSLHAAARKMAQRLPVSLAALYAKVQRTEPAVLRMCVAAPTEYAGALFAIERQANGRPVDVHRYGLDDEALIQRCDVIYLGVLAPERRLPLFERLQGHAILSISEQSRECIADAVFCLQPDTDRVRFRVNLDALARSGVRVHPAVLKLAKADEGAR